MCISVNNIFSIIYSFARCLLRLTLPYFIRWWYSKTSIYLFTYSFSISLCHHPGEGIIKASFFSSYLITFRFYIFIIYFFIIIPPFTKLFKNPISTSYFQSIKRIHDCFIYTKPRTPEPVIQHNEIYEFIYQFIHAFNLEHGGAQHKVTVKVLRDAWVTVDEAT